MKEKIKQAIFIIKALGYPKAQQNDRSGLCLLGLLNLTPDKDWKECESPLVGITPLMEFARNEYAVDYKPNTRETFRRQTIHQFVAGGLVLRNPDDLSRPVNSPKTVYQIEQNALELIKCYGREQLWKEKLEEYLYMKETLAVMYAKRREKHLVPVKLKNGEKLLLTPGEHSELIRDIIEEFASRFAPGSILIYVGDTGSKIGYFDKDLLAQLGVEIDKYGKMPDVVLYYQEKNWVILVESVTSHGPVDPKRHNELAGLFKNCTAGLIYVTAFPNKALMANFLSNRSYAAIKNHL